MAKSAGLSLGPEPVLTATATLFPWSVVGAPALIREEGQAAWETLPLTLFSSLGPHLPICERLWVFAALRYYQYASPAPISDLPLISRGGHKELFSCAPTLVMQMELAPVT